MPASFALVLMLALAAPSGGEIREAELLAAKGVASYKAQAFESAGEYFLRAYALSAEPTQLRNAAKSFDAAGQREVGRKYWAQFVRLEKVAPRDRAEARARLKEREQPPKEAEIVAVREDTNPEPIEEARPQMRAAVRADSNSLIPQETEVETRTVLAEESASPAPWLLAGAGLAGASAGVVLLVVADSRQSTLQSALTPQNDGLIRGITFDAAAAERSQIGDLRLAGGLLTAAGGAALAGGVIWLLTRENNDRDETLAIVPLKDGAAAAYGASW